MKYHQALGYHYVAARGAIGESRRQTCLHYAERNVSLLTDCSVSDTFFDEVKALHCFQRK